MPGSGMVDSDTWMRRLEHGLVWKGVWRLARQADTLDVSDEKLEAAHSEIERLRVDVRQPRTVVKLLGRVPDDAVKTYARVLEFLVLDPAAIRLVHFVSWCQCRSL